MENNLISIENLSYTIGRNTILSDISLNIKKGDFISIIGPNGAGKTTFIKLITNLLKPSSGNIFIDGLNIKNYKNKDLAKKLSYIPQTINIYYDFTVEEIVLMGRLPYLSFFEDYSNDDYKCIDSAMKSLDILHLKHRSISTLSGGELQRVFLARALAQNAKILVLDEAMSELDIGHQISIIDYLKKLQQDNNLTIISVMHDINIAFQFFDTSIVLQKGVLRAMGNNSEIITEKLLKDVFDINTVIKNYSIILKKAN